MSLANPRASIYFAVKGKGESPGNACSFMAFSTAAVESAVEKAVDAARHPGACEPVNDLPDFEAASTAAAQSSETSMTTPPILNGLVPARLAPKTRRIFLEEFDLPVDIGFHDFEVGNPQRLLVSIEVWVDEASFAAEDNVAAAWNYDFLRTEIGNLVEKRRFNLQETLARAIYDLVAARAGVTALRVSTRKPDIYPDCAGVGVELASF